MSTFIAKATGCVLRRSSQSAHANLGALMTGTAGVLPSPSAPATNQHTQTRGVSNIVKLFNLDHKLNEEDVHDHMAQYGTIRKFNMNFHQAPSAQIEYKNISSAYAAVDDMEGTAFFGQRVTIAFNQVCVYVFVCAHIYSYLFCLLPSVFCLQPSPATNTYPRPYDLRHCHYHYHYHYHCRESTLTTTTTTAALADATRGARRAGLRRPRPRPLLPPKVT